MFSRGVPHAREVSGASIIVALCVFHVVDFFCKTGARSLNSSQGVCFGGIPLQLLRPGESQVLCRRKAARDVIPKATSTLMIPGEYTQSGQARFAVRSSSVRSPV